MLKQVSNNFLGHSLNKKQFLVMNIFMSLFAKIIPDEERILTNLIGREIK